MQIKRQLFFLHIYNFLFSLRIADGVWVMFLLSRGFSLAQVGIAESVFHVVSFLFEIPSGMMADLLGRKRTLVLASFCGVLTALAMAFSSNFWGVCLAMVLQALMYNFCSGSQEALTYDSLKAAGMEDSYLKQNAWLMGAAQVSASLSSLLGGAAALLGYFPAYAITALCSCACGAAALALVEPQVTQAQQQRNTHPFAQLGPRLRDHIRESVGFLWKNPRTGWKILAGAGAATPIYLTFMYLQQHLLDAGLPSLFLGAALMSLYLAGTAGTAWGSKVKLALYPCGVLCGLLCGAATLAAGLPWWPLALLGGCAAECFFNILDLRLDASLNNAFPSDQRATLVSVNSMVYSMLMIAASPLTGAVGDAFGTPWTFWVMGAALLLLTGAGALWFRPGRKRKV
ncbi:MAG: MFS transporter [Acutalibacter sp.]|jgi:MFS family permease